VDLVLDHGEVVASDVDAGGNRFVLQRAECVQGVPREGDQVFHAFGFYYGSREGRETCTTPRFKVDLTPGLPCGRWWPATTAWWPRSRRS
jgi:hypothetical protein